MSTTWTLASIEQTIRRYTGRFSENEMTSAELRQRINQYYVLTFPLEVHVEQKFVYYSFLTEANQAYYDTPDASYVNFIAPAVVNNLSMLWYQDPVKFQNENYMQYTFLTPWTGDGVTASFSTTVTGFPIFPGSVTITDNTETFEDLNNDWTTSNVNINGSLGGTATINYATGTINITFNTAPTNGQNIYLNYIIFAAGRPQSILYYNNQFQLYPVPDQSYVIKMQAYKTVSPLTDATDTPDLNEWGRAIVYGTAKMIFSDYGEIDSYSEANALHKEQISNILTRTEQDLLNTRAMPQF